MRAPTDLTMSYIREYRELTRLGLPVLVTQLGIIAVSFADTAMIGAYGVNELAACAFANSLFMIPMVMMIGFAQGTTPLAGALYGKGDTEGIGRILKSGLQVNLYLSLCFLALMGTVYFLLDRFNQPDEIMPMLRPYYLTMLGAIVPMALFNVCQQTSNGITDTSTPMWIILGANCLNILGNYLLIYGHLGFPELGLTGAGLATLSARVAAMLAMFACVARGNRFRGYWLAAKRAVQTGRERVLMWRTSYPVMLQSGLEVGLWTAGTVVCGWFGAVQLASYQVVNTISQLGFMIFLSFGVATSVRVANFTGQNDLHAVRRVAYAGLHINLVLATAACLVFYFFGRTLAGMFSPDEAVIEASGALILPLILYQYGDATQLTFANSLRGTARVRPLMAVAFISYCLVGIPVLYWLAVMEGGRNVGVYYSFSVALFLAAVLLWGAFHRTVSRMEAGSAVTC